MAQEHFINQLEPKHCDPDLQKSLQVVDEYNEKNDDEVERTLNCTNTYPFPLSLESSPSVFGKVVVTKSKNVQFGNNTYINGPVTIKQVIHSRSGLDNLSFSHTDDDRPLSKEEVKENSQKKFKVQMWHKITIITIVVFSIGVTCSIALTVRGKDVDKYSADIIYTTGNTSDDSLIIAPYHLRVVGRSDWIAQPPEGTLDPISHPVPWVIIAHTATEECVIQSECVLRVRYIQMFHIESRKWSDIGYNFLVGGDGSAYVGRGWDYVGAHTKGYNNFSIGIAFIGTFNSIQPTKQQVDACRKLIDVGVQLGKLSKDYKLLAHRQLMSTLSPGNQVYNIIKHWPHFVNNVSEVSDLLSNQK